MEVIHKPTGEKRWIKASRFNPEFHIKPDGCKFNAVERIVKIEPRSGIIDLSGLGQKKEEPKVEPVLPQEEVQEEKDILDDVKVDEVVNETDDLESLPMPKIRQLCKAKGLKATPTMKKIELIAMLRQAD